MYHYNTNDMDLAKALAIGAKKKGICREWHDELKTLTDKDSMIQMYLRGIDFCLKNEFPDNDFIKANFGDKTKDYGIFVDGEINVTNAPKCVCLGNSTGQVTIDGYNVCEIFVKHSSALRIEAKGNSFVMIDVFDDSTIMVNAHDNAKVCVNRYGGDVKPYITEKARIKIKEKNKKTY